VGDVGFEERALAFVYFGGEGEVFKGLVDEALFLLQVVLSM
jgi:hypothetical protein